MTPNVYALDVSEGRSDHRGVSLREPGLGRNLLGTANAGSQTSGPNPTPKVTSSSVPGLATGTNTGVPSTPIEPRLSWSPDPHGFSYLLGLGLYYAGNAQEAVGRHCNSPSN